MEQHANYAVPCYMHYEGGVVVEGCEACDLMGDLYVQGTLDSRPPGRYSAMLCFDSTPIRRGESRDIVMRPKTSFRPMAMRVPYWTAKSFMLTGFFVAKKIAWDVQDFNAGASMLMFDCLSMPIEIVGPIAEPGEEIMIRVKNVGQSIGDVKVLGQYSSRERCTGVLLGRKK